MPTIIRLPDVIAQTGLARSTIYLYVSNGSFPKPIKLGESAVGWVSAEVDAWIASKVELRDSASIAQSTLTR
jgi:prophage regulatory protein